MLLAVHLGEERKAHEFVVLLVARPFRQLRGKPFGVRKHLVHVGVAPDDHLGRAIAENIERRLPRPVRDQAVRILFEFSAAEVDRHDFAAIQNAEEILPPHGHLPIADVESVRRKRVPWKGRVRFN